MTVALVLGAGGPVGYAFHAGVLAALADAGWDPRGADLIVGTSIGAVTAGLVRAGMPAADLYARVEHTPLSPEGAALVERAGEWPTFPAPGATGAPRWGRPASPSLLSALARRPRRARPGLVLAALTNAGTVDTAPIRTGFDRLFASRWPAGTVICAVDLDSGERTAFGTAAAPTVDMGAAIAASCAVPSYFAPVELGGHRYVDGGVHSPANTDVVAGVAVGAAPGAALSAVIVSVPMGRHGPAGRRGVDLPGRAFNHRQAVSGLAAVRAAGVPILLVEPTRRELEVMHYDAFDQAQLPEVAARARRTLTQRLQSGGSLPEPGVHRGGSTEVLSVLLGGHGRTPTGDVDGPDRGTPHASDGTGAGGSGPT